MVFWYWIQSLIYKVIQIMSYKSNYHLHLFKFNPFIKIFPCKWVHSCLITSRSISNDTSRMPHNFIYKIILKWVELYWKLIWYLILILFNLFCNYFFFLLNAHRSVPSNNNIEKKNQIEISCFKDSFFEHWSNKISLLNMIHEKKERHRALW